MNALVAAAAGAPPTMSSREIADLVEARHDSVKRTIERLVERAVIVRPPLVDEPSPDAIGRQRREQVYRLGKRDSYVIVAQLSPEFTARLVDRWQELEERQAPAPALDLNDPRTLKGLLLANLEKVEDLEGAVAKLRPQAEALALITEADGELCVTESAKAIQVRPSDLFAHMRQNAWTYRRPGSAEDTAYQARIAAGLLVHKVTTIQRPDGSEKVVSRVRITPKGLAQLAQELAAKRPYTKGEIR